MDAQIRQASHDAVLRRVSFHLSVLILPCSEIKKLRAVFDTLDIDGSGAIGVEELVDPFIALGLADTVMQVQAMVDKVDDDGSGEIEFKEFKKIVKGDGVNDSHISNFFRDLFNGKFGDK